MKDEIKEIINDLQRVADRKCYPEDILDGSIAQELVDYITNLQKQLEVSQTNEETYRLEMLDITKCLGLNEDTIFDEVKEKATNLQEEKKLHNKILKDANDVLNIQAQKGNYNYDSYMLGLYNGMEMIVSLFEQREPKFKCGKDIKFLHETDYKSRIDKAIEYIKENQYRLDLDRIKNELLEILGDDNE